MALFRGAYWANKVSTYGMVSAQLYWGRMAAMILHLLDATVCFDWGFVCVDHIAFLIRSSIAAPLQLASQYSCLPWWYH